MNQNKFKLSDLKLKIRTYWSFLITLILAVVVIISLLASSKFMYLFFVISILAVLLEYSIFKCPACKNSVGSRSHYCSRCGNKVDYEIVI